MRNVNFQGRIPASKSEVARALVIASFADETATAPKFESSADDVQFAKKALAEFLAGGSEFFCGDSATLFRFLALRVSRKPGSYALRGSEALFSRPHDELINILKNLGVESSWRVDVNGKKAQFNIHSTQGWVLPKAGALLEVDVSRSSQFISAVVLNSWGLPSDFSLRPKNNFASKPYFDLSLHLLRKAGMKIDDRNGIYQVAAGARPSTEKLQVEADWSSAFFMFALGAVGGRACVENLKFPSEQADSRGLSILQSMGFGVEVSEKGVCVSQTSTAPSKDFSQHLESADPVDLSQIPAASHSVDVDLSQSPDLFPVLACLCATVKGKSRLRGLGNLAFKESDRKARVMELLNLCGVLIKSDNDGVEIEGRLNFSQDIFDFDPRPDHRLVMAACVLKVAGMKINLLYPETISKSFPEFLELGREWLT